MADLKISELTADVAPTGDDLIPVVNDPAGTPGNRKVTLTDIAELFASMAAFTGAFAPKASPTFTGNVVVPDADADTEAMNRQTSDARYGQVFTHTAGAYSVDGGRIFIGSEDPSADGFTPALGDIWMEI